MVVAPKGRLQPTSCGSLRIGAEIDFARVTFAAGVYIRKKEKNPK